MGSKSKAIGLGLLIAAIVAGGFYYFLRPETLEEVKPESVVSRMAFSGSNMTEMQDGRKVWDLSARVMEVDTKTQWVYMTDLKGKLFRLDGTQIDVRGAQAVVDPKTRNIEISGGLTMKANDGTSFSADQGRYVADERKIYASGSVKAVKDDMVMTAAEFEADDRFDLMVIKGNARIVKGGPVQ